MSSSKVGDESRNSEPVTCIVGKPYASIVLENNWHKFVINNKTKHLAYIHPFLVDWIMEEFNNEESPFHMCEVVECFYEYKQNRILYRVILISEEWVHGMTGLWLLLHKQMLKGFQMLYVTNILQSIIFNLMNILARVSVF